MSVFSWRTTLSAHLFNNSPRLELPGLPAELVFTLLTYGFALSNLARLNVAALGTYERDRGISEVERKAKDEKLGFAVMLLCRASGLFEHVSSTAISGVEQTPGRQSGRARPPELSKEVSSALSKCDSSQGRHNRSSPTAFFLPGRLGQTRPCVGTKSRNSQADDQIVI